MVLVTGASGSGKSEYAENVAVALSRENDLPLYYIATMRPFGEEGRLRVERHRKLRAGKGFKTIERYTDLKGLEIKEPSAVVLLECMSNLTANEMFDEEGAGADTVEAVLKGAESLAGQCRHTVIVTNDIFSDGVIYDGETRLYQERLGLINRRLAAWAGIVTEVVCGIPLEIKRSEPKSARRDARL